MIDSHCHLADEAFAADLDAVVARARDAGLTGALCILSADDDGESARAARVRDACGRRSGSRPAIHPHQAGEFAGRRRPSVAPTVTARPSSARGACAIGEIGLDYHYDFSPRDVQQEVFARAGRAGASSCALPVDHPHPRSDRRHLRASCARRAGASAACCTASPATSTMARAALDLGFYISLAGIVTFPQGRSAARGRALVPADRLLVETDAPYLAPVPHRGKRNEPAFVAHVAEPLCASVRGAAPRELAARRRAATSRRSPWSNCFPANGLAR